MRLIILALAILWISGCIPAEEETNLKLWYEQPARVWTEALPVGNGSLGAMVFGGVERERIQFNEETLWTGAPNNYAHPGAHESLDEIRQLLNDNKQEMAHDLAMEKFMSIPLRQMEYQPFGDLHLEFPGHKKYAEYYRELDLKNAVCRTTYLVGGVRYTREIIASYPHQVIGMHITADRKKALSFSLRLDSGHEDKLITTTGNSQTLRVAVKDGVLSGTARIVVNTDGVLQSEDDRIKISGAESATIWLSAATNYKSYKDVGNDPVGILGDIFKEVEEESFEHIKKLHLTDYHSLFDRFDLDFGNALRDSLPSDERLLKFAESPDDPQLLALYAQYGRYLLISSSRPGTGPANLQGIWNQDLKPAWGSKYTININTEMNYWPAELTNLSECHEPLFNMIKDLSVTGQAVAREHYMCEGWVAHHNTDLWRGAAPINHSNHGMWVGGSGWLSHHLWEHYLFTRDEEFLREEAWPVMKGAAQFYAQFLVEDTLTGCLISTPSNSPENGGMVAGPTMDHQIIRSLFKACVEAAGILDTDQAFALELREKATRIAPNQIGRYGQLQEWLRDVDDPENTHRHVSHLWGMHPAKDINWESSPELMQAAKQSLIFRGDKATGWSLAWKINFWARLLDGDHAYELIKLIFRPVFEHNTSYSGGGGSYPNFFDAHPPFQIDGNFGATAGIVEMLIQSHLSSIDILPALPASLPEGSISGVCARGGFELSFQWSNGALTSLEVLSRAGSTCKTRYKDHAIEFPTIAGKIYRFDGNLNDMSLNK
ncbi:MAG: glycoside hydrolase family 95 protein [Bacteroidota bacterium]